MHGWPNYRKIEVFGGLKKMDTKLLAFSRALAFLFLFSSFSVAFANDFNDGLDAYGRRDYETAYKLWLPLAEQGLAQAQLNLGMMYMRGQGVSQDYKKAVRLFRLSAEQGLVESQFNLGVMYKDEEGVPQDYKEAVKWFRLSAEQGVARAQNQLGKLYRQGLGVPQDYKEAVKWYRLAAEQEYADAQSNLGVMYREGQKFHKTLTLPCISYITVYSVKFSCGRNYVAIFRNKKCF